MSAGRANTLAPTLLAMVMAYLAFKNFSCKKRVRKEITTTMSTVEEFCQISAK